MNQNIRNKWYFRNSAAMKKPIQYVHASFFINLISQKILKQNYVII